MSEYQEGLTAPPFHPWCRCCTAPYFADMEGLGERFARDTETGKGYKVPGDMTFEQWKKRTIEKKEAEKAQRIETARPLFEKMQEIGLFRMPTLDKFAEMQYNASLAYKKLFARYQNLTGDRTWSAVEFNPETIVDHVNRHGREFGISTAQEYEKAALAFINAPDGKLSFIDAEGTRRFFEESTGTFASAYPDGTLRTYFKPKTGIKYWKGQVKKFASEQE